MFYLFMNTTFSKKFKYASAYLLRGARHALHDTHLCNPPEALSSFKIKKTFLYIPSEDF